MKPKLQRSLFGEDEPEPSSIAANSSRTVHTPPTAPPIRRTPLPTADQWMKCDPPDDCEWVAFLRRQGRVPQLTDAKGPWEYRGWPVYYRLMLEEHLEIPARWDYWYRTMAAGHLLDEPIPEIHFTGGGDRSAGYKLIDSWVRLIDRYGGGWSSPMPALLDWLLWGFGLSSERPTLHDELNEQLYRAVNLAPLLLEPGDYFGKWIANQKGKCNPHAFFPTPEHVVELMVRINFIGVDWKDALSTTVYDPCMGSGRMLILSAGHSLRLFGMDIDGEVVRAAKVNGALYAPWLVRPFPDEFFTSKNCGP